MEAEESGAVSYLDETLMRALVFVRRLFDKFIVSGCHRVAIMYVCANQLHVESTSGHLILNTASF